MEKIQEQSYVTDMEANRAWKKLFRSIQKPLCIV